MKMVKYFFIAELIILIFLTSCELGNNEGPTLLYRFIVTVNTDLDSLMIDSKHFYKGSEYPDTLFNIYISSEISNISTIYPVIDTGYIHLDFFKWQGYDSVQLTSLVDSLTIYTPIDTTIVLFRSISGLGDTIIINPSL